jgi:hypothetical protein
MALAFDFASAFELAPQACKLCKSLVGLPSGFFSGPGILPILAKKEARLGLSPDFTGAFRLLTGFSRT